MNTMSQLNIKPTVKERLEGFAQSDRGRVSYSDAIETLLNFWESKHKKIS